MSDSEDEMTVSDVIEILQDFQRVWGDIPVARWDSNAGMEVSEFGIDRTWVHLPHKSCYAMVVRGTEYGGG